DVDRHEPRSKRRTDDLPVDRSGRSERRWRRVRPEPADPAGRYGNLYQADDRARADRAGARRRVQRPVTSTAEEAAAENRTAGTPDLEAEMAFALDLAGQAGAVLMDRYERLEQIDYKSARDVVTEADHLSEALIVEAIKSRHPGDAILAEETGEHRAVAGEAPTSGRGRVWIVDPLDGTVNYANGIPVFCVSIALVVDGVPTVGVILDPTRSEAFAATRESPATLNGRPVTASDKEKLSDFVISMALAGRSATTRARNVRRQIRI